MCPTFHACKLKITIDVLLIVKGNDYKKKASRGVFIVVSMA